MCKWDWVAQEHLKTADEHAGTARAMSRLAQAAWSEAVTTEARARAVVEESRQCLRESDRLLRWWQAYGPLPGETHSEEIEGVEDVG